MTHAWKDIELTDEERQLLADAAKQTGRPWRLLLREAIARFIKAETEKAQRYRQPSRQNLLEKLERLGAVGMIPRDPTEPSSFAKPSDK